MVMKMLSVVINKIEKMPNVRVKLKAFMPLIGLFLFIAISNHSNVQQMNVVETQAYLKNAVKKAYAASVRIWGFDVERNERTSAQFSGVVVSEKGIILTAAHTISPGRTYKIFFPDGREVIAKALGRIDLETAPGTPDAGMMQILDKGSFPFVEMGFSASLKVNEACISISYPERINLTLPTLRYGKIAEVKNEYGFIRSTCKMEPGDSGGPLFDQLGRLIGIHSAIDVNEEMNFEIPIDVYRKYWTALQEQKNYTTYPTQTDSFSKSSSDSFSKIWDLDVPIDRFASRLIKKNNNAFLLTSKLEGVDIEATGTVINYVENEVKKQFVVSKNSIVGDLPYLLVDDEKVLLEVVKRDNWLRGDQTFSKSIKLMNRPFIPSKHPVDRFIGGSSERRDGYKQVFTHDAVLTPSQCGSPIFGVDGEFLGINIARYSRAVSLGIPCAAIIELLK
ncbi:MAG: trypsin-like serine protease [Pedobacter sp.]|nr:MAG: trypsin-like serine protease [Pedobacter sp.]